MILTLQTSVIIAMYDMSLLKKCVGCNLYFRLYCLENVVFIGCSEAIVYVLCMSVYCRL